MTTHFAQDLDSVRDYYTQPRQCNGKTQTIYEIWEGGHAFGDSVTPSSYCREYQSHMLLKLESLAQANDSVFSIGCGNAVIEGRLVERGRRVSAIDCNEEAVAIARSKQVVASVADIMQMAPGSLEDTALVYADGLVGHLFNRETGLKHFFDKLRALGMRRDSTILISNDAPRSKNTPYEAHPRVDHFWFVSPAYLAQSLQAASFKAIESYTFPYIRPESGLRQRTICVASS